MIEHSLRDYAKAPDYSSVFSRLCASWPVASRPDGADDRATVHMYRVRHRLHTRDVGAHEVTGSR
jgi:hypothetical protein